MSDLSETGFLSSYKSYYLHASYSHSNFFYKNYSVASAAIYYGTACPREEVGDGPISPKSGSNEYKEIDQHFAQVWFLIDVLKSLLAGGEGAK